MKAFNEETNWLYLYIGFLALRCVVSRVFWSIFLLAILASLWSHTLGVGDSSFGGRLSYFYLSLLAFLPCLWFSPLFPFVSNLEESKDIVPHLICDKTHTHGVAGRALPWPALPAPSALLPEMHPAFHSCSAQTALPFLAIMCLFSKHLLSISCVPLSLEGSVTQRDKNIVMPCYGCCWEVCTNVLWEHLTPEAELSLKGP